MTRTGNVVPGRPETQTIDIDTDLGGKEKYFVIPDGTDERVYNIASGPANGLAILIDGGDGSSTQTTGAIAIGGFAVLKLGGTVAVGDFLTSDASAQGIATTTDTNEYGAKALANGVIGDEIPVQVITGFVAG